MDQNMENGKQMSLDDLEKITGGITYGESENDGNNGNEGDSDTTLPSVTYKNKKK